jgi:hypothetical protein
MTRFEEDDMAAAATINAPAGSLERLDRFSA